MEHQNRINPLLEAMAFLGRKASGNTWEHMDERIRKWGIEASEAYRGIMESLKQITARLKNVDIPPETLALFQNLDGFSRNTIGSASRAFFLLYGFLESYQGDFSLLVTQAAAMSLQERAYHIALALDMAEDCAADTFQPDTFMKLVLSLSISDTAKVAILETYQNFPQLMATLSAPMTRLLVALERELEAMHSLSNVLHQKLDAEGCEVYLSRTSSFTPAQDVQYQLRPFVFGLDTDLTSDCGNGRVCMYCGILRQELLAMLSTLHSSRDSIFNAFRLFGDKTRFELVCYLSDHSAYGQELSQRFDLSRNTIHHHMSKLSECGLVRCTADGNRVYYTLNREQIRRLIAFQEELLHSSPTQDTADNP